MRLNSAFTCSYSTTLFCCNFPLFKSIFSSNAHNSTQILNSNYILSTKWLIWTHAILKASISLTPFRLNYLVNGKDQKSPLISMLCQMILNNHTKCRLITFNISKCICELQCDRKTFDAIMISSTEPLLCQCNTLSMFHHFSIAFFD